LSGHLNAGLLEHKTVVFVNSQHSVDAELFALALPFGKPNRVSPLLSRFGPGAGVCCSSPNICSSQPSRQLPLVTPKMMSAGTRKLSSQSKLAFDFAFPCAKTCCAKIRQMIEIDPA
jgi:hypothetical protein